MDLAFAPLSISTRRKLASILLSQLTPELDRGLGQWQSPVAYRKNLRGVLSIPEVVPFWNIEKS